MTPTVHEPTSRHSRRRHPAPRAGLIAFLVLAVVAAGAGFVVRAQAERPAATATPRPDHAVEPAAYLLSAEATAEARAARFRISTTRSPAAAVLALDPAGKSPARTVQVDLSTASTEVVVRGLAVGRATWTITSPGAPTLRGRLRIPAADPSPGAPLDPDSATPLPSSTTTSAAPAPAEPSHPAPTTRSPQPAPTEPRAPQPTPRPTGPASPYDPDDD